MKMNFSTDHLRKVFAEEGKYEAFKKLTYDLNHGNEIFEYDSETGTERKISNHEANQAVRKILMEVAELDEESVKSEKKRNRMLRKHEDEIFELIEEDVEFKVETGLRNNEWFLNYVEYKNIRLGDDDIFYKQPDEELFEVAEISSDFHDLTKQYLKGAESYRIHTKKYGIKIGKDIDMILLNRIDFTKMTNKIAESFESFTLGLIFAEIYKAAAQIPNNAQFVKTGALGSATKSAFDTLIEDVEIATNSSVIIMGSKVALKKLTGLTDINWISNGQKEDVARMGRLGSYEGTALIEIPQRFAQNDVTTKLIPNDKLLLFPVTSDQFVKFVDRGETTITERGSEKGELANDFRTYEVKREFGVGTQLGQYFGQWTITA